MTILSRRKLLTAGTLLLAGGAAALFATRSLSYDGKALTVEQAFNAALAGDITLIDIRRPEEWNTTGIGGPAHPIDMRRKDFVATLDTLLNGERDRPVALICARGVRSARMSNHLSKAGFTNIIDVPEGMLGSRAGPGWLSSKLPVRRP